MVQEVVEIGATGGFHADENVENDEEGIGPGKALRPRPVVHESDEQWKLPAGMGLFYIPWEEGASLVYSKIDKGEGRLSGIL